MLKQFKTVIDKLVLPKYPEIIEYDIDVAGDVELVYFVTYELKNNVTTISREEKIIQEENKLSITEIGIKVSEFCHTHFEPIFNYRFTERMEAQLDLIGEGKQEYNPIIKGFIEEVNKLLTIDAPKISYRSLHCGTWKKHAVVIKDGPYGFYVE